MFVTFINAFSVVLGGLAGLALRKHISENFKEIVMISAGLVTLILGLAMCMNTEAETLPLLFSLIIGGFVGYAIKIEDKVASIGRDNGSGSSIGIGFLNSSVLFCSGAMSIVGSINAGLHGDDNLILIKSVMDGFMAVVLASAYGAGVLLSAIAIIVYQGFFVLASSLMSDLLGDSGIAYIAAAGGYLLLMISLNLLNIKKIKTANFIPALVLSPILGSLYALIDL